ncbi:MAG: hypothetical protein WHV26_12625 [Spirochaetota bacterium]
MGKRIYTLITIMRIGKFYPVKSNKILHIHDYIEVIVYDNDWNDKVLKCEIEDVIQNGLSYVYKIFVPHPYKPKL